MSCFNQVKDSRQNLRYGRIKLELLGGIKEEKEFQRLKTRLDALEIVETNTSLWERAYDLAYRLRRKGITVPYTDILIAASALMVAATVVHADSHFDLMEPHCGLKVESFVDATKKLSPDAGPLFVNQST